MRDVKAGDAPMWSKPQPDAGYNVLGVKSGKPKVKGNQQPADIALYSRYVKNIFGFVMKKYLCPYSAKLQSFSQQQDRPH